jgi:hypothetical protein
MIISEGGHRVSSNPASRRYPVRRHIRAGEIPEANRNIWDIPSYFDSLNIDWGR